MTDIIRAAWSGTELAVLKRDYSRLGAAGVAALLPNRTLCAIRVKAHQLQLTRQNRQNRQNRRWTAREVGLIRQHFPAGGARACAPFFPDLTTAQIALRANHMGVRRDRAARLKRQSGGNHA